MKKISFWWLVATACVAAVWCGHSDGMLLNEREYADGLRTELQLTQDTLRNIAGAQLRLVVDPAVQLYDFWTVYQAGLEDGAEACFRTVNAMLELKNAE